MSRTKATLPAVTIALGVIAGSMIAGDAHSEYLRLPAILAFLSLAPGGALVALSFPRLGDWSTTILISIGLSAAVDVAVAQAMLWLHFWRPSGAVVVLAALTVVVATVAEINRRRTRQVPTASDAARGEGWES